MPVFFLRPVAAVAFALFAAPAVAQVPPPMVDCLCLKAAVDTANADMSAKNADLGAARAQLDQIDQQLATMRAQVDVNNPQQVAQFRQLLAQRDDAARRASGPGLISSQAASGRYNDAVNAYNAQCAGRPLPPPPPGPLNCPMMR